MTRRWSLLLLALVLGVGPFSGCAYYNTFFHAEQFYDQAVDQQEKAAEKTQAAAVQNQTQGRNRQGQSHELFNKCIEKCRKLAEKFPGSKWRDDASLLMAKAYYGKKDYLSAKSELLRFIDRYPGSELLPDVYYQLGLTYYRNSDYAGARSAWSTLETEYPEAPEIQEVSYYLAQSYEEEGDLEAAEAAYEVYISSQGRSIEAFTARLDRAAMWLDSGNIEGAREDLLLIEEKGRNKQQRLKANLLLAQTAEAEGDLEKALELYWDQAFGLDSNYQLGRISAEERSIKEQEYADKALEQGISVTQVKDGDKSRKMLDKTSWEYDRLARVLLSEGEILAKLGRIDEAILAFQQVMAEYAKTDYASEAQYRIGYTHEVYTEDLDAAERAYKLVSTHGRSSFSEDAISRAGKLSQVKNLASAPEDSSAQVDADLAKARFLKAELFLFQQERPEKAVEEYEAIQRDFAGTDYEGKAALAEAYVRLYVQEDPARGRAALADVMKRFGDTEYGVYARRILKGPDPEPDLAEFAGPELSLLLAEANVSQIARRDSLLAASQPKQSEDDVARATRKLFQNPDAPLGLGALNLHAVPERGSSPILNAWEREPRVARNRLERGFPFLPGGKRNEP